jgi:hypothetical protein
VITGILVGLAWGGFALKIRGRTVFGHLRALGESRMTSVLARIKADLDARIAHRELEHRPKESPPVRKPAELRSAEPKRRAEPTSSHTPKHDAKESEERLRQDEAMARLEAARGQLGDAPRGNPKTRVDERIPAGSERAVSELVRRSSE